MTNVPAVGILAARLAQIRGAKRVIMIDNQVYRLKFAEEKVSYIDSVYSTNLLCFIYSPLSAMHA